MNKRDLAELHDKLEALRDKATSEAQELITELEERIENLGDVVEEEIDELKEVGPMKWVQLNPRKALIVAGAVGLVIGLLALLF